MIQTVQDVRTQTPTEIVADRFSALVLDNPLGVRYAEIRSWQISDLAQYTERLSQGPYTMQLVAFSPEEPRCTQLLELDHGYVFITISPVRALAWVLTKGPDEAATVFRELGWVPAAPFTEQQEIMVSFRTSRHTYDRMIAVPTWEEIRGNYPLATYNHILPLLERGHKLAGAGKLILWHGLPGTGKTTLLRTLGWEWRKWCSLHYITDPEIFFGDADYMLSVLLSDSNRFDNRVFIDEEEEDTPPTTGWKLLVAEDTGGLLKADEGGAMGQGLSRLLNVVDGMIGQGLKLMVLITTNEEIRELHPAVRRPGRCMNLTEFQAFDREGAQAWLKARGGDPAAVDGPKMTISEMFAIVEGRDQMREGLPVVKTMGFK